MLRHLKLEENLRVELARRDALTKQVVALENLTDAIKALITEIQSGLFQKALDFRADHITKVETFEAFKTVLEEKTGFISAHWDGTAETEDKIKELTKATIRCIPIDSELGDGVCVFSGKPSKQRVLFAKAY